MLSLSPRASGATGAMPSRGILDANRHNVTEPSGRYVGERLTVSTVDGRNTTPSAAAAAAAGAAGGPGVAIEGELGPPGRIEEGAAEDGEHGTKDRGDNEEGGGEGGGGGGESEQAGGPKREGEVISPPV